MALREPREKQAVTFGPGFTKQAFKDQVDINKIIEKHRKTGMITHLNSKQPFYGDVSNIKSYQDALNLVNEAETLFNGMSSQVRKKFSNNPAQMVEFLQDPKNLEEAINLGMVVKRPEIKNEAPNPKNEGPSPDVPK